MPASPPDAATPVPASVALTGATGFIGRTVLRHLTASNRPVRALYRAPQRGQLPSLTGVSWVAGALEDEASLERLVRGTEAVVHCAGRVRGVSRPHFDAINVDGVARLASVAARQSPPPRILLISSLAARAPELSPYAASKRGGEEALADARGDVAWSILRPPAVYGPGDRELLPLLQWMGRGLAPVLGPPNARFSLLYVDDLARAALCWLESGCRERRRFELHDGQPAGYSWTELAARIAEFTGGSMRRLRVPGGALHAAAAVNAALARVFGYDPMLTPGKVRELRHPDWVCDNEALTRAVGWKPEVGLERGLELTLGWRRRD